MNPNMNLDVSSPELVPVILAAVAQKYREDAQNLRNSWQDSNVGIEWDKIASILERAEAACHRALNGQ